MTKRITLCIILLYSIAISNIFFSQDTSGYLIPKLYGFENIEGDSISNSYNLNSVYEELYQLKTKQTKVSFFHFGDSHLQADYISHTIRTTLQKQFGNAGRGLVTPLKIAKTNEPFNYLTQSPNNWKRQLIIAKKINLPIGVTGVTIKTKDTIGTIKIKTFNTDSIDYSFNKIQLFFDKDSSFTTNLIDSNSNWLKSQTNESVYHNTLLVNEATIQFLKKDSTQSKFTFFGCNLENNKSGILYHSTGVNGAKYSDFNKETQFINQIEEINPKIILISLGTNESFMPDFDTTRFYLTIDSLITKIHSKYPQTTILLTTPACSYKNHKKNTQLTLAVKTIKLYATKNKLPLWDLFEITGGENSAINWKKNLLLSRDGVHYTKNGYILQGQLFTLAFLKGYNQYVKHRLQ